MSFEQPLTRPTLPTSAMDLIEERLPLWDQTGTSAINIALDYDDTFTANRAMWTAIIGVMKYHNCNIKFVTARFETPNGYSNDEIVLDSEKLGIPIIFCNGVQKAQRCDDVGFAVDIWIDDFPVLIPRQAELECILRGARVNDGKQRTVLRTSDKEKKEQERQEALDKWASNPLIIGG